MASKKKARKTKAPSRISRDEVSADSAFPYCTAPNSLRRFLTIVPDKPRPPKVTTSTLQTWGLKSGNDSSILRVLKKLDLLGSNNETTQAYADYMRKEAGAAALGQKVRQVYIKLFENVSKPETAPNAELKNFFNIYSGGGERAIQYQIDTFKALAEHSTFGQSDPLAQPANEISTGQSSSVRRHDEATVHIDLHIHLPENKSKSDYDAILESIANHIYGRNT